MEIGTCLHYGGCNLDIAIRRKHFQRGLCRIEDRNDAKIQVREIGGEYSTDARSAQTDLERSNGRVVIDQNRIDVRREPIRQIGDIDPRRVTGEERRRACCRVDAELRARLQIDGREIDGASGREDLHSLLYAVTPDHIAKIHGRRQGRQGAAQADSIEGNGKQRRPGIVVDHQCIAQRSEQGRRKLDIYRERVAGEERVRQLRRRENGKL